MSLLNGSKRDGGHDESQRNESSCSTSEQHRSRVLQLRCSRSHGGLSIFLYTCWWQMAFPPSNDSTLNCFLSQRLYSSTSPLSRHSISNAFISTYAPSSPSTALASLSIKESHTDRPTARVCINASVGRLASQKWFAEIVVPSAISGVVLVSMLMRLAVMKSRVMRGEAWCCWCRPGLHSAMNYCQLFLHSGQPQMAYV